MRNFSKQTPIILIGLKIDLREEEDEGMISKEEGEELSREIGAYIYAECSAKTQEGLRECFDEALKAVFSPKKSNQSFLIQEPPSNAPVPVDNTIRKPCCLSCRVQRRNALN